MISNSMCAIALLAMIAGASLANGRAGDISNNTREQCKSKVENCSLDLHAGQAVCGSDGVTYPNKCKILFKQCMGLAVTMKHTGACARTAPCLLERRKNRLSDIRPVCLSDGSYAPVQCHAETRLCWCVTRDGRLMPNTTVRNERPRCVTEGSTFLDSPSTARTSTGPKFEHSRSSGRSGNKGSNASSKKPNGKKKPVIKAEADFEEAFPSEMRRRSDRPRRWRQSRKNRQNGHSNNRHKNVCDRADKAKFNGNLIENFRIEYRRINATLDSEKNSDRVLTWKFGMLDRNEDGYLDKSEYKELRRLAKKAVRPKKCARTFARSCDVNRDMKLSIQEWAACLANDFAVVKSNEEEVPAQSRPTFSEESSEAVEDTDSNDCISDRRSVLEDQRQNSQEKFYIPECTADGRYHKVQCYSGYCWCVYQDTGKPIPGTSSKDKSPNCNPVPAPVRPMKGCPEAKKQMFLRDLMELMRKKMKAANSDPDEPIDQWQAPMEERVATWHFVMLDKNKNKVLERREWKSFRTMVSNNRQLRRCGKKLPRYCDINNDRRISMTEWLSCLNAQRPSTDATSTENISSTFKPRRMGPNPLDQFLNDDD